MARSGVEVLADDIERGDGKRVHLLARFNGEEYYLGATQPINSINVELVDLLRHIADEIEAIHLTREAKAGE